MAPVTTATFRAANACGSRWEAHPHTMIFAAGLHFLMRAIA